MRIPPPSAAKARILLLDEDRILLQSLAQFLRREGYAVHTTDRPAEAVAQLEAGQIDLLLVDLNLPGIGGVEFLRSVRRCFPQVLSIVVTGHGSIETAVEATKLGAFDYLTKPVIDDEIRLTIEKAARQQALLYENHTLRNQLDTRFGLDNVVGHDTRMLKVFDLIGAVADTKTTVLMTGESGTASRCWRGQFTSGRRGAASRSWRSAAARCRSRCSNRNCSATSKARSPARSPTSPAGSSPPTAARLFLDEINSASPAMQVKLLRVLQERTFEAVGSNVARSVDVRVILASNVNLATLVAEQKFRQDLYYRINVVTIGLPNLRDRLGDIPLLAGFFLRKFKAEMGREIIGITPAAMAALQRYPWPGNVRELENAIERAVVLCARPQVDVADLPDAVQFTSSNRRPPLPTDLELDEPRPLAVALQGPERRIIEAALRRNHYSRQATAAELEINRTTLYKKMRQYRLDVGEMNTINSPSESPIGGRLSA